MRAAATTAVVAGTATAVSGRVARRQDARYQQKADAEAYQQQQAYEQQQAYAPPPQQYAPQPQYAPPPAPAPGGITPDVMEQLKGLGQLHEQGVLTDEEFAAQKAKLLG
jgi:hypothetical protein